MSGPGQAHVELLERLVPDHRVRKDDKPAGGRAFIFVMAGLAVIIGLVCGMGFSAWVGGVLQRAAFAEEGVPVRATVLETNDTQVKVEYLTPRSGRVVTWVDGEYRPDPERIVPVLYLSGDHTVAQLADRAPWPGWPLLLGSPVLFAVLCSLHHRLGFRAGWFVRRFRVHAQGPPERPRRLVPLLVTAVVLVVLAAVPVVALLRSDRTEVLARETYWTLIPVPPLLFCALIALIRVAYRYAEDRPVTRFPRPFRLLPAGVVRATLVLLMAVGLAAVIRLEFPEPMARPVRGTAEVLGVGSNSREVELEIRYEVDGVVHRRFVEVGDSLGEGLLVDDTVDIVWDADDPGDVRVR
ncbi:MULTISPECIES: hypothetical protein [unclassified Nocardiopsis]|uniref:hypothetical protein n=1 Tax=Nocardiopsis TaxID=2013 RepID=UPI00387B2B77